MIKDLQAAPALFIVEALRLATETKCEMSNFRVLWPAAPDLECFWMENIWRIWKCSTDLER